MQFKEVYTALKEGKKIKRFHWSGYWIIENDTIMMHCWDGGEIPFLETQDLFYTLDNIIAEDWEILED